MRVTNQFLAGNAIWLVAVLALIEIAVFLLFQHYIRVMVQKLCGEATAQLVRESSHIDRLCEDMRLLQLEVREIKWRVQLHDEWLKQWKIEFRVLG